MKKHEFGDPTNPLHLAPFWLGRKCIHCHTISGLDDWQLLETPVSMAVCPKGKKVGFVERLISFFSGSINTLK